MARERKKRGKKRIDRKIENQKNKVLDRIQRADWVKREGLSVHKIGKFGERKFKTKNRFVVDITDPVKTFCEPLGIEVKKPVLVLDNQLYGFMFQREETFAGKGINPLETNGFHGESYSAVRGGKSFQLDSEKLIAGAHESIHAKQESFLRSLYYRATGGKEKTAYLPHYLEGKKSSVESGSRKEKFMEDSFQLSMFENPERVLHKSKTPGRVSASLALVKRKLRKETEEAAEYLKEKRVPSETVNRIEENYPHELSAMTRKIKRIEELLGGETGEHFLSEYREAHDPKKYKALRRGKQKKAEEEGRAEDPFMPYAREHLARANAVIMAAEHVLGKTPEEKKESMRGKINRLVKEDHSPGKLYWEILKLQKHLNP